MTRARDLANIADGTFTATDLNLSGTLDVSGDVNFDSGTFFVDVSANSVGIGTSSPAAELEVVGTGDVNGAVLIVDDAGSLGVEIQSSSPTIFFNEDDTTDQNYQIRLSSGTLNFQTQNDARNAASTKMTLDSSGNVGIGTSSPGAKLHVNGGGGVIRFGTNTSFYSEIKHDTSVNAATLYNNQDSSGHVFQSNGSDLLTLNSSGNLGLGVTPSAWSAGTAFEIEKLGTAIWGADNNNVWFLSNAYYDSAFKYANSSATATAYQQVVGEHRFYSAPSGTAGNAISFTQAMTINSGGNLRVGTTASVVTAAERAAFVGSSGITVQSTGGASSHAGAFWNTAGSGDNLFLNFYTGGGALRGSIDYNRTGGLTRYNTTSDYRAKDILGPVENAGATIDALNVYEGVMKGATQSRPMLIAHEAQEQAPYAVSGTKDAVNDDGTPDYQKIDHSSLVPLLIAEIQSLRARVAQLEGA